MFGLLFFWFAHQNSITLVSLLFRDLSFELLRDVLSPREPAELRVSRWLNYADYQRFQFPQMSVTDG